MNTYTPSISAILVAIFVGLLLAVIMHLSYNKGYDEGYGQAEQEWTEVLEQLGENYQLVPRS